MLSRILAIFSVSLLISRATDGAPAVATARQFLPAVPGYVPVYIRTGDTPLEEINPDLAEAFNSYSLKHARGAFSRSSNAINDKPDNENAKKASGDAKDRSNEVSPDENLKNNYVDESTQKVFIVFEPQHIQKIPRA